MSDIKSIALYYRGTEVKKLQEKLVGLGYSIPEWEIKQSTFGKGTKQALVDFQQTVSLSTTGILDESTNTSLEKAIKSQEESGKIDDEVNTSEEEEKLSSEDETSEVANEEQEDAEQTISSSADDSDKTDSSSKYKIEGRLHFSDGQNPSGVVVRVYSRSFQSDDLEHLSKEMS